MMPSVVNVSASTAKNPVPPPQPQQQQPGLTFAKPFSGIAQESIGSGVVVTTDGYILTNYHVIEQARHINVTVFNDMGTKRYHADVIGRDEMKDLALLKITPARPLTPAALGNSEIAQVGDSVIAIGSPFGLDQTVSKGIISGKNKVVNIGGTIHKGLLQTDAAINRGNSGGPLVDENGYVIGINTAIYTTTSAFAGVGFAVTVKHAKDFLEEFITLPKVRPNRNAQGIAVAAKTAPPIAADAVIAHEDRGDCAVCHKILPATKAVGFGLGPEGRNGPDAANRFSFTPGGAIGLPAAAAAAGQVGDNAVGVAMKPLDKANIKRLESPVREGVLVVATQPQGPLARAGIRPDDIIFKLDGRRVGNPDIFTRVMAGFAPGETIRVSIVRGGDRKDLSMLVEGSGGVQTVAMQQPMQQTIQRPVQQTIQRPMQQPAGAQPRKKAGLVPARTEFEWMGLEMTPINGKTTAGKPGVRGKAGGLVAEVDVGSAAARAGIKAKDIIVAINGKPVGTAAALDKAIKDVAGQAGVLLEVERNGQRMFTVLQ